MQYVKDLNELTNFERDTLAAGFEGVMVRRPDGPYKQGRSTLNEQILLRIKRFRDGEAVVLDIEEGKINNNEAIVNALGYIERQTLQANMKRAGRVGTLICQDLATGDKMRISPGRMTQDMRVRYWTFPTLLLNQKIKYKCFDYGAIDAPRFATFQSFLGVAP
jgi:DNA ligase-1